MFKLSIVVFTFMIILTHGLAKEKILSKGNKDAEKEKQVQHRKLEQADEATSKYKRPYFYAKLSCVNHA